MNTYLIFKSLHLIAIISWMAGLLYLPRIFVYHTENSENIGSSAIFKTMEKKLYNYIMMPAMILSWIFGLILISILGFEVVAELWIQIKLFLVIFCLFLAVYFFSIWEIPLQLILLVGANTRVNSSIINARIRKNYINRNLKVYSLSSFKNDLTFNYKYLGKNIDVLNDIFIKNNEISNDFKLSKFFLFD